MSLKRSYIRIISFVAATILILGAMAIINMRYASRYKSQLELSYQQSLNELSEGLDLIETNLEKSMYSSSGKMLLEISSDLYSECTEAQQALSRLPVSQMNLYGTYKFINQASDFANYLAKKVSAGEEITEQEHKTLSSLLNYAKSLNSSIEDMVDICNNGGKITSSNVKSDINYNTNAISSGVTSAEKAFESYPTLLYDGPFADAVLSRDAKMLEDKDEITRDEAKSIAANALGCNEDMLGQLNDENGDIPCYVFSSSQKTIGVTIKGGYVSYILYGGKISKSVITESNAINIAKSYLDRLGYTDMKESYYMTNSNICVINFAYTKGNTVYYSDLIKVGISMLDGRIVSLNAQGYLTNHINREPISEKVSIEDAKKGLSPYLILLDSKKCLIPLDNGLEAPCWEFHCRSNETGDEVLIYINTETGNEENILLLLYSDGGTLTK